MRRNLTIAGVALLVLALAGSVLAQQPQRIRVGGEGEPPAPKVLKRVEPVYPKEAKEQGIQGPVVLRVIVGTDGKVIETEVVKPLPILEDAAIAAVMQWEYTPTLLNGERVEVSVSVQVVFKLN